MGVFPSGVAALLGEVLQQIVQLHAGAGKAGADGANGDAEGLRCLLIAETFHVGQQNADAQAVREHKQGVFQLFVQSPSQEVCARNVGGRSVGLSWAGIPRQRQGVEVYVGVPPFPVVEVVDEQIGENAEEPGPGIGAVLETPVEISLVGADQRVLG